MVRRLGGEGASVVDIEGQTREGGEYGSAGGAPSVGGALSYPQCMAISRCAFCGPAMRSTDRRFRRGGLLSRSVVRAGAVYITYLLTQQSSNHQRPKNKRERMCQDIRENLVRLRYIM